MTQEEKQTLIKDLSMRLPYGVHGEYSWKCGKPYKRELTGNLMAELILSFNSSGDSEFKPYLRPMSSMTEGEILEFIRIGDSILRIGEKKLICILSLKQMDWLNAHHFDYRIDPSTGKTLIESNLAIEAPKDMYKNE